MPLVRRERGRTEGRQGDRLASARQRDIAGRGRRSRPVAVVDDHGECRAVSVVVSELDQRVYVEQGGVEPLRRQQPQRRPRHDVEVSSGPGDRSVGNQTVRAGLEADRALSVAVGDDVDDIARDQRDLLQAERRSRRRMSCLRLGRERHAAARPTNRSALSSIPSRFILRPFSSNGSGTTQGAATVQATSMENSDPNEPTSRRPPRHRTSGGRAANQPSIRLTAENGLRDRKWSATTYHSGRGAGDLLLMRPKADDPYPGNVRSGDLLPGPETVMNATPGNGAGATVVPREHGGGSTARGLRPRYRAEPCPHADSTRTLTPRRPTRSG